MPCGDGQAREPFRTRFGLGFGGGRVRREEKEEEDEEEKEERRIARVNKAPGGVRA